MFLPIAQGGGVLLRWELIERKKRERERGGGENIHLYRDGTWMTSQRWEYDVSTKKKNKRWEYDVTS